VLTDLGEVRRLGELKAAENLEFRRYVSAHHWPEAPFQVIATEVSKSIDCTACANCCRESVVAVEAADIASIARHLGYDTARVEALYTAPGEEDSSRRVLKSGSAGCVFLSGNLCVIYEARPKACRDFPHAAPGAHTLGSRLESHLRWAARCPIIYNALEQYKHATGFHAKAG